MSGYKDDVIVINDCSMIDNEKRRSDILQCILEWNCDNETQPHITTVFSDFAQYLIPENKKVCFALSDTFYKEMTQEEEQKMCHALDCIMRYLIDTVCEDYTKFKEVLLNHINF